jgi:hypothetical protein
MPPHDLAPLIMGVTVTLSVAGVLILRPLMKRLGTILELRAKERHQAAQVSPDDITRLAQAVGRLTDRIEDLEERQDFAERLLASPPSGGPGRLGEPRDG